MKFAIYVVFLSLLTACSTATTKPDSEPEDLSLKLVVTDVVSAIVQIRELNPTITTLQISKSVNPFGNLLYQALEDAGYGLQVVSADQGAHYVSYAVRSSETEAGKVDDYLVQINDIQVRREYNKTDTGIYPTSVMFISGTRHGNDVRLNDLIFSEQGGGEYFISGVESGSSAPSLDDIRELVADENSRIVENRRTRQQYVLDRSRMRYFENERKYERSDVAGLKQYRRLVVLFPDNKTLKIGTANKIAIANLVRDFSETDLFEIRACDDIDGKNLMAERRAIRIKEEFVSHGLSGVNIFRAPCTRSNYRHQSDDSPTPVAIFQYREPNRL